MGLTGRRFNQVFNYIISALSVLDTQSVLDAIALHCNDQPPLLKLSVPLTSDHSTSFTPMEHIAANLDVRSSHIVDVLGFPGVVGEFLQQKWITLLKATG